MRVYRRRIIPRLRTGDWRSKLIAIAQIAIGFVALLGLLAMLTFEPLLLLAFAVAQGFIVVGVILFVIVAIFAQRTMVLEQFGPGEIIFREGEAGRHVYVVKTGTVEVLIRRPDDSQEMIKRLGPGAPFGEMALLRDAPRAATIRTVTPVQVYRMHPGHFTDLYTNLPGLRRYFRRIMRARARETGRKRREAAEAAETAKARGG
ncbi:MAG: cyclic nucleotide-binding domain-containing protein [Candidatus Rokuibacteriota bacterium]